MDIFQRSIHSNVKTVGDDHLQVTSQLIDLEHSFHLEMTVRISTKTIESASATMSKTPLKACLVAPAHIKHLEGLVVGRGILKRIHERMGGPRGCAHLEELSIDAIRLISMILIGISADYWDTLKLTKTEDEIIEASRDRLRNSCFVFADE